MKQLKKSWHLISMAFAVLLLGACDDENEKQMISASNTVGLLSTSNTAVEGDGAEFGVVFFGLPENQPGDITVNYSVAGDGVSFTGSVTIPDGEQTATFDVVAPENTTLNTDTVELTLTLTGAGSVEIKDDVAFNTHTFDLYDDIKMISIANDTTDIDETYTLAGDTIKIPVIMSSALDGQVSLNYTVAGDATADVDYELLSANPLVMAAGTASGEATIDIVINDDLDLEGSEMLSVTLDDIVVADASDSETMLATGAANTNIVYNISDDTKMVGFTQSNQDTIFVDAAGTYSAEISVSGGSLNTEVNLTFDDTELLTVTGLSDNNAANMVSLSPGEESRTITFTVTDDAIDATEEIVNYDIIAFNSNGDAEASLSSNTRLVIKILSED